MNHEDPERRLRMFEQGYGTPLVQLASHAALPVVLNPDFVHLLRVNYFLDPPATLNYTAEAELLLSPLCTEVDQGLYVIDPELRDVLLQHLIEEHGSGRLHDVASLLWEYGQRSTPWLDRPGLSEAQQLTALNFIDPARAHDWLTRAEASADAGAAVDKRWFVTIRRDLRDRTAALQRLRGPAIAFWDVLEPVEREALRSVASWRTFAAGARIMEEGERADHVMVILGGQVEIRMIENGSERVVAVRGLGQLVGERAALTISVRSATVVALQMVWALVVQTKDFAAFISAHPRVLDLVQDQQYQRRAAGAPGYEYDDNPGDSSPGSVNRWAAGGRPDDDSLGAYSRKHRRTLNGENCTVFLTDVVDFGAHTRTDNDRLLIREALFKMTQRAMQGFPEAQSEDRGDGFLTVVPPNASTARVLDQLLKELPAALELHNSTEGEQARFKLRLAVNVGPVVSHMDGVSGEATIVAARLIEAPSFKRALAGSNASLGVITSPFVYEVVVRHSPDLREVASYFQVPVEVKETSTTAWMRLFGHSSGT